MISFTEVLSLEKFVTTFRDALPERRAVFTGDHDGAFNKAREHLDRFPDDHVQVWWLPTGEADVMANYECLYSDGGRWKS